MLALLLLGACANSEGTPDPARPVPADMVRYTLGWDTTGIEQTATEGFAITRSDGALFVVSNGWLTTRSVTLTECPKPAADALEPAAARLAPWRLPKLLARVADAGHSGISYPMAWTTARIEAMHRLEDTVLAQLPIDDARYCQSHWLMGEAPPAAEGLPEHPHLIGKTMRIAGTATKATGQMTPFVIESPLPMGVLQALPSEVIGGDEVRVRRRLVSLFDGVDPWAMDSDAMGRALLLNLRAGTTMTLRTP